MKHVFESYKIEAKDNTLETNMAVGLKSKIRVTSITEETKDQLVLLNNSSDYGFEPQDKLSLAEALFILDAELDDSAWYFDAKSEGIGDWHTIRRAWSITKNRGSIGAIMFYLDDNENVYDIRLEDGHEEASHPMLMDSIIKNGGILA